MLKNFVGAGVISLLGVAAVHADVWDCNLTPHDSFGWVMERIIFQTTGTGQATVLDGIIQHRHDGPINARFTETGKALKFGWKLSGLETSEGGTTKASYSANIEKATSRITVRAILPVYDNQSRASGICRRQ